MSEKIRIVDRAEFGATNLHPLSVVFMSCMIAVTLASRRSGVILAVLSVCLLMPNQQRIVLAGLDFSMLRLILMVAWIRVFARGEYCGFRLGRLDLFFLLWVFSASFFYVLRLGPSGIVYRLGASFDLLAAYFLIRVLVRTRDQVLTFWRHLAWLVVVLSPLLLYEAVTMHAVFGALRYDGFDLVAVRDETARAQGPFSHPILAGTFGCAVMPVLIASFLGRRKERILFASACVGATIIVVASGSSGPLVGWLVGILGWTIWRLRKHVRPMLWAGLCMAVVIHFVREKPVWHLITRLSSAIGGTGYHRYRLIDAFIEHFSEWALVGTSDTAYWGWGLQDTTNQYVAEGVNGGLVTLILFIVVLGMGFARLRFRREVFERMERPTSTWALLAWGSSVSLAVHCVSFISVSYYGEMLVFFVLFVATVPAFDRFKRPKRVRSMAGQLSASARRQTTATRLRSGS